MRSILKISMGLVGLTIFVNCSQYQQSGSTQAGSLAQTTSVLPKKIGMLQGTVDSGGGRALLCHLGPDGQKEVVTDFDLYEAYHTSKLQPAPPQGTLDDEWRFFAIRMTSRLAPGSEHDRALARILSLKGKFLRQAVFAPITDVRLKKVDDSKEVFSVDGCESVQLAFWQDDDTILIQKELWEAMPARDQAALIAHEFLFNTYRSLGHRNSIYPRRLVGLIFSTAQLSTFDLPNRDFECHRVSEGEKTTEGVFDLFGRVDLTLPAQGEAGSLTLSSYPSQILLTPVRLQVAPDDLSNALEACRGNDRQDIQLETAKAFRVHTSYFKDQLEARFSVACGKNKKQQARGPELTIALKSHRVGNEVVYNCKLSSQIAD